MGELVFMTETMASGKTTHLLQAHFNIDSAFPSQTILLSKNDREGEAVCTSRLGQRAWAVNIEDDQYISDLIDDQEKNTRETTKYVFIDEAQFLTIEQVEELAFLADIRGVNVYAYGLLTTYKGEMFPASKRLIELADNVRHLKNGMRCWCGKPATHNGLFIGGKQVNKGTDAIVDNSELVDYHVMCRRHFLEHIMFQSKRYNK